MNRTEEELLNSSLRRVLTLMKIYADFEFGKTDENSENKEKSEQEVLQSLFNAF